MARIHLLSIVAIGALSLPACLHEVGGPDELGAEKEGSTKEGAEVWSSSDSPSLFADNLKYALTDLPAQGEAANIPWASSYWPTYQDSINYKWDGASSDAPSTKYGKAFSATGVEDAVSNFRGIDSNGSRKTCKVTSECKSDLGEECAIRAGKTEGKCVPTWFGICHAWAPAAILAPEPKHAVTKNGVTFKVNDIKALVTLVHDGVETKFVSLRCDKDDRTTGEATGRVEFDENGRPKDQACRDSNAGSFHVLIANYLGVQRASFVFDQTFDDEVWNQPLRGYRVVETRELTAADAIRLLGVTATGGTGTSAATSKTLTANVAQGTFKHFDPIAVTAGAPFKAIMSGTGDGDLYVRFGSQPTEQAYDCRPYSDGSAETCESTVPANATQAFVSVHGYTQSNISIAVTTGGTVPTAYPFNAKAKKLVYMKTDVQYIGESSSDEDGNLATHIDRYTSTNRYEYILEIDDAGKIIGGEWVGNSKRMHPDFAWLPVRVRGASVAGGKVRYADVKALLDASVADENGGGTTPSTEKTVKEAGVVAKGDFKIFGPYKVAAGKNLTATMTGTGDADLYVRKGSAPNVSTFDCRPYKDGSAESCTVAGGSDVYVAISGYATTSNYDLTVVYTEGGGTPPPPPPPPPAGAHLNTSGNVALNAYAYFTVPVIAGKLIVIKTTAAKDIDLYLQMDANPTSENAIAQAYTSSGNENIRFVPSTSGVLHIGVHGYEASAFTLVTSDN